LEEEGEDQVDAAARAEDAGALDEAYGADEEGSDGNEGFDPEAFRIIGFAAYCEGGPDEISWWEILRFFSLFTSIFL